MTDRFVYFIKPIGLDGPIKIGCSECPADRLMSLSTWSPFPLEIIATVPGGFDLEKNVHECFAHLHSHREWFRAGPELLALLFRLGRGLSIEEAYDLSNRVGKLRRNKPGGASWSVATKRYMGLNTRMHAAQRRATKHHGCEMRAPAEIWNLVHRVAIERPLTETEQAEFDAFVTSATVRCLTQAEYLRHRAGAQGRRAA